MKFWGSVCFCSNVATSSFSQGSVCFCSNVATSSFSQGREWAGTSWASLSNRDILSLYLGGGRLGSTAVEGARRCLCHLSCLLRTRSHIVQGAANCS